MAKKSAKVALEAAANRQAAPLRAPALTCDAIGDAAGGVWKALHDSGEQSLAALKKASGAPPDLTLLAVGWLAREGKLGFSTSGKSVKVSLRD